MGQCSGLCNSLCRCFRDATLVGGGQLSGSECTGRSAAEGNLGGVLSQVPSAASLVLLSGRGLGLLLGPPGLGGGGPQLGVLLPNARLLGHDLRRAGEEFLARRRHRRRLLREVTRSGQGRRTGQVTGALCWIARQTVTVKGTGGLSLANGADVLWWEIAC